MLCEHCRKREATVKYVEVVNGVRTEHNFCTQCAGHVDMGHYSALFEGEFPLGRLLSGLLGMQDQEPETGKISGVVCPTCKTTYEEFVKDSRFGCPDCYSVFDPLIGENIRRLQGSERHVGKRPKGYRAAQETGNAVKKIRPGVPSGTAASQAGEPDPEQNMRSAEETVRRLKSELRDAVRVEDYERAAGLRDEIRRLEEEQANTRKERKQDGKMV